MCLRFCSDRSVHRLLLLLLNRDCVQPQKDLGQIEVREKDQCERLRQAEEHRRIQKVVENNTLPLINVDLLNFISWCCLDA